MGHSSGYESMRTDIASGTESACELDGSGRRKKKRFLGTYFLLYFGVFLEAMP